MGKRGRRGGGESAGPGATPEGEGSGTVQALPLPFPLPAPLDLPWGLAEGFPTRPKHFEAGCDPPQWEHLWERPPGQGSLHLPLL